MSSSARLSGKISVIRLLMEKRDDVRHPLLQSSGTTLTKPIRYNMFSCPRILYCKIQIRNRILESIQAPVILFMQQWWINSDGKIQWRASKLVQNRKMKLNYAKQLTLQEKPMCDNSKVYLRSIELILKNGLSAWWRNCKGKKLPLRKDEEHKTRSLSRLLRHSGWPEWPHVSWRFAEVQVSYSSRYFTRHYRSLRGVGRGWSNSQDATNVSQDILPGDNSFNHTQCNKQNLHYSTSRVNKLSRAITGGKTPRS